MLKFFFLASLLVIFEKDINYYFLLLLIDLKLDIHKQIKEKEKFDEKL